PDELLALSFRLLPLRDVAKIGDHGLHARFVQQVHADAFHPSPRAVLVPDPSLNGDDLPLAAKKLGKGLLRECMILSMDEFKCIPAKRFLLRVSQQANKRGGTIRQHSLGIGEYNRVGTVLYERAKPLFGSAQRFLSLLELDPLRGLAQRSLDRGHEPRKAVLQDDVGPPQLDHLDDVLLAQHAGDEDERNLRTELAAESQRRGAVKPLEREVREDEVRLEAGEIPQEIFPRRDPLRREAQASLSESPLDKESVVFYVLHKQDAQLNLHDVIRFPLQTATGARNKLPAYHTAFTQPQSLRAHCAFAIGWPAPCSLTSGQRADRAD